MEKNVDQANNQSCSYFQIPKVLFVSEEFKDLPALAKTAYGLLYDRSRLSKKNGWVDADGNVFLYYTIEELAEMLGCSKDTASKMMKKLEHHKLIVRQRQGQGKPWKVVVNCVVQRTENAPCGDRKKNHLDPNNSGRNKNYHNKNINQNKKREMDADEILAAQRIVEAVDYLAEYGAK